MGPLNGRLHTWERVIKTRRRRAELNHVSQNLKWKKRHSQRSQTDNIIFWSICCFAIGLKCRERQGDGGDVIPFRKSLIILPGLCLNPCSLASCVRDCQYRHAYIVNINCLCPQYTILRPRNITNNILQLMNVHELSILNVHHFRCRSCCG